MLTKGMPASRASVLTTNLLRSRNPGVTAKPACLGFRLRSRDLLPKGNSPYYVFLRLRYDALARALDKQTTAVTYGCGGLPGGDGVLRMAKQDALAAEAEAERAQKIAIIASKRSR